MAHIVRPLMQWPRWRLRCCSAVISFHLLQNPTLSSHKLPFLTSFPSSHRCAHFRSRALRLCGVPPPSDLSEDDTIPTDGGSETKKSRNEKKREARRAVRWGMELAKFSPVQIKRILSVASLEQEVFDALMLAKRLGRDVREGKRRQFSYIGKLLREVEPELMDQLIQATKDCDMQKFQALSGSRSMAFDDNIDQLEEDEEVEEDYTESDDEEQDSQYHVEVATRWFDGLVDKDIGITNEIYSLTEVEFDRQELRQLVRKVHSMQERKLSSEEDEKLSATVLSAKRSLTRFLHAIARQLPAE